jgi:hypothetical protein
MKYWIWIIFIVSSISSCSLREHNGSSTNSSIQTVDMGEFNGLRIIEIASLNYPETLNQIKTSQGLTEIDKSNFSDTLIQSLKKSDVSVLPSAQTKIHIEFTQLVLLEDKKGVKGKSMAMTAFVAVSRNGIVTREIIQINSKVKSTIGGTKDNGVKMFIQKLGELLREQSSFKR